MRDVLEICLSNTDINQHVCFESGDGCGEDTLSRIVKGEVEGREEEQAETWSKINVVGVKWTRGISAAKEAVSREGMAVKKEGECEISWDSRKNALRPFFFFFS